MTRPMAISALLLVLGGEKAGATAYHGKKCGGSDYKCCYFDVNTSGEGGVIGPPFTPGTYNIADNSVNGKLICGTFTTIGSVCHTYSVDGEEVCSFTFQGEEDKGIIVGQGFVSQESKIISFTGGTDKFVGACGEAEFVVNNFYFDEDVLITDTDIAGFICSRKLYFY